MGHKITRHVERSKLNSVLVIFYLPEHSVGDSLRRLAQIVSGEHSIDVGIVYGPEALLYIYGIRVYRRDDKYLMSGIDSSLFLELLHLFYKLCAAVDLLYLVTSRITDYTYRFLSVSELESGHAEIIAVHSFNLIDCFPVHRITLRPLIFFP